MTKNELTQLHAANDNEADSFIHIAIAVANVIEHLKLRSKRATENENPEQGPSKKKENVQRKSARG